MTFKGKDVIAIEDFSKEDIVKLIDTAQDFEKNMEKYKTLLNGNVIATLFFEPSTRTRMSFQAATYRLGGGVVGFSSISTTSLTKGETLKDTMRIVSGYADIIVVRHPKAGAAKEASEGSTVPIVNAGDGANEHPTQTFLDVYTIKKEFGKLEGLKIGFLGDLKNGRTVHSLTKAMSHFKPEFHFIATESLQMPDKYLKELDSKGIKYKKTADLLSVSKELDILYVTRVQKERFTNQEEYDKVKGLYILKKDFLKHTKPELRIMHPLPRVDEIDPELDDAKQSIYFEEARNGLPVRAALLALILGKVE